MEVFCKIPMKKMREDSLTELDLSEKGIGAHGAMVIAPLLEFSRALTSLDLSENSIVVSRGGGWTHDPNAYWKYVHTDGRETDHRPDGVDFEADLSGIQALAGALKANRSLKYVDLRNNSIPDGGCQQLSAAVGNKSITLQLKPQEY